jgi:hypothetical protein
MSYAAPHTELHFILLSYATSYCTVKFFFIEFLYFFYQTIQKRENPYADKGFFGALQRMDFLSFVLRREKFFSNCRGNFFLAVGCYISLFPLFPYYIYRKINGRFLAGHRSARQSGHKIRPLRKNSAPFVKFQVSKPVKSLVKSKLFYREK